MNKTALGADAYFTDGCGRCPLGGTPSCKIHLWTEELSLLRSLVLDCGLQEERKWGVACYTYQGSNVALIGAFKEYCSLSFFKGALLHDEYGILRKPGENTQAARLVKFTNVDEINQLVLQLKAYIFEAIEIEKAGLKVEFKKSHEYAIPEELEKKMKEIPKLRTAFQALSPGRQRAYLLHFSSARQSKTRELRIEKCIPAILAGKGLND
jgi:uncharacterized protein YdeI (YjbR/CyaY-like superfamily)